MSEQTQIIDESNELMPESPATEKKGKNKAGTAIAAGAAVGLGAIAYDSYAGDPTGKQDADSTDAAVSDSTSAQPQGDTVVGETQPVSSETSQPAVALIPDHLNVINAPDTMSFDEAFAWSREKAGPAQLFEWHGELYHTCHANEYAALPAETKDLFEELWVGNEFGIMEIPAEGQMITYDFVEEPATDQPAVELATTDSTEVHANDDAAAEQESTSMDSEHYDVVYSHEDYDNNFDGLDEWVNPEDIA